MNVNKLLCVFASLLLVIPLANAGSTANTTTQYQYAIFNGSTYINTGIKNLPTVANARSVFAWIDNIGGGTIYSYGLNSPDEMATISISNGTLSFIGLNNNAQSTLDVPANSWQLVGYTYISNSTNVTFYLDGRSQTVPLSSAKPLNTSGYPQSSIGKVTGCSGPCSNFMGDMANLRVYTTALNATQASSLYFAGPALGAQPLSRNLAAWWMLNGSTIDYSGNGNTGAYYHLAYSPYSGSRILSVLTTPGGSASASPSGSVYIPGTNVTITASPNLKYSFVSWSCSGMGCYSGSSPSISMIMNSNITETANFQPTVFLLTVLSSPTAEGRVAIGTNASNYHITSQELKMGFGANTTIYEAANPGYQFINWSCTGAGCGNGGYSGSNPVPTVAMHGNITEAANFRSAAEYVTVTTGASPSQDGSSSGAGTFLLGQSTTLTAMPNPGYVFVAWSCTGEGCYSGTSPYESIVPTANITEVANFEPAAASSITAEQKGLEMYYYAAAVVAVILILLGIYHYIRTKPKPKPMPKPRSKRKSHRKRSAASAAPPSQSRSSSDENPL